MTIHAWVPEFVTCAGCRGPIPHGFRCDSCSEKLKLQLRDEFMGPIIELANKLWVGRTHWPERRLLEQVKDRGLNVLSIAHWAINIEEADTLELWLIEEARRAAPSKTLNPPTSEDDWLGSFAGLHQAVYIAWTSSYADKALLDREFGPIWDSSLDPGRYIRPTTFKPGKFTHLASSFNETNAYRAHQMLVGSQMSYSVGRKRW